MRILTQPFHDYYKMSIEGVRTRDGHLIREFLHNDRVAGVHILNRPLSLAEAVLRGRLKEVGVRGLVRTRTVSMEPDAKLSVTQVTLPHIFRPLLERRDYWATALASQPAQAAVATALKAPTTVLLLSNPFAFPLLKAVPRGTVVAFDAIDDWLNHPEIRDSRGRIAEGYSRILERADVVVTNAEVMQSRLKDRGAREAHLVRNGVRSEWLEQPPWVPPSGPVVLGYAGKLAKRIDVKTLCGIAEKHPLWRIELAGPVLDAAWVAPLRKFGNVLWLGDRPHDELPELFRRWHVGLIPHNVGKLENGGHPIKLYEYLAIGIPVVTTPIGGVDVLGPIPFIAQSGAPFVKAVEEALAPQQATADAVSRRRAAVREWTWKRAADQLVDLFDNAQQQRKS